MLKRLEKHVVKFISRVPLRTVLIVPFVAQIVGAVALTGYLSFRNGQETVNQLADRLMQNVGDRVLQNLNSFLTVPHQVNQANIAALQLKQLDLQNVPVAERHFWRQLQIFDTLTSVGVGLESKDSFVAERGDDNQLTIRSSTQASGYLFQTYRTNAAGDRTQLLDQQPNFDARIRPWYQAARAAGKPTWSSIYPRTSGLTAYLGAVAPFYDVQQQLQGVFLTNINLSQISRFLQNLQVGTTGQMFIIERSGDLVATSTGERPVKITSKNSGAERVSAIASQNSLTRATAAHLVAQFGGYEKIPNTLLKFSVDHQPQLVKTILIQDEKGLDWIGIVVVPESDFMAKITANTRDTLILCLASLLLSTTVGILTARWIATPILRLNEKTKTIAAGEWAEMLKSDRVDEIGELTNSLNQMATQLQQSFANLQTLNQELSVSESRLTAFLEALPIGISVINLNGTVTFFNRAAIQLLGIESIPNSAADQLPAIYQIYQAGTNNLYPSDKLPAVRALKGEHCTVEDIEVERNGSRILLEVRSTPIFDGMGNVIYAIDAFQDITTRKEAEKFLRGYSQILETEVQQRTAELTQINGMLQQEIIDRQQAQAALQTANHELERLTTSDGLTQVANRRCFDQYLAQEWRRLMREQQPIALIMCDVDYFKLYNDTYGHQAGDDCLRTVAMTMSQAVNRPADLVARYGGEEFVVILPNTELSGAIAIAQTIRAAVNHLNLTHETSEIGNRLTISLGVSSMIPGQIGSPEALIAAADRALYRAKQQGRDRVEAALS